MHASHDLVPENGHGRRVAFATVGCRLNQAETDAAMEQFTSRGWTIVPFNQEADLYYVNTCTVTGAADRSSRQLIHRARRRNNDALLVAAGCFAVRGAEELAQGGEVDLVLGIREKARPFDFLPESGSRPEQAKVFVDTDGSEPVRSAVGTRVTGRSRAFLKVQDGCDHACAYCAVTLARGPSRSAAIDDVRQALRRVHASGFEEVVITGVDVTAWGQDLPGTLDFITLVEEAAEVGIPRVRLSSLEPWEVTPERIARLAAVPAWCEHFHLSLQSADPELLVRMGRPTDLGRLKEALRELQRLRPRTTLGADIIAGFPGETDAAHQRTVVFLDEGPLHYLHVFPFSPRPGTPAAELGGRVDPEIIKARAEILRTEGRRRRLNHLRSAVGERDELLIEQDGQTGYTRGYLRARLVSGRAKPRTRVSVILDHLDEDQGLLHATKVDS